MSKGNPIVGLAYVVTSQQEMLEKANEQIEELKQELENLDRVKSQKLEDVYKDFQEASEKRAQAEEHCEKLKEEVQNAKKQEEYVNGLYKRACDENVAAQEVLADLNKTLGATRLSMEHVAWHAYDPEQKYELDEYGLAPMADGLYYHHENSGASFYDEKEKRSISLKYKFDVYGVHTNVKDGHFTLSPYERGENGSTTLIAVRITYWSRFMGRKWEEIEPHIFDPNIEDRYLEALADPNHADAEG